MLGRSRGSAAGRTCSTTSHRLSIGSSDLRAAGHALKQGAERGGLVRVERAEDVRLDLAERFLALHPQGASGVGGDHQPAAPVGRVRAAFDELELFEVVDEVREDGAVDAELLGDRALVGRAVLAAAVST